MRIIEVLEDIGEYSALERRVIERKRFVRIRNDIRRWPKINPDVLRRGRKMSRQATVTAPDVEYRAGVIADELPDHRPSISADALESLNRRPVRQGIAV
jgi:hypothetical protein